VYVVNIESTFTTGAWSTLLLGETEVSIAVVSWVWIGNSLSNTVQEYVSFVEIWAVFK
jgi:hypothetical protein